MGCIAQIKIYKIFKEYIRHSTIHRYIDTYLPNLKMLASITRSIFQEPKKKKKKKNR